MLQTFPRDYAFVRTAWCLQIEQYVRQPIQVTKFDGIHVSHVAVVLLRQARPSLAPMGRGHAAGLGVVGDDRGFRQQYPDIRLHFSEAHQPVDMMREGFDCILRAGELSDSPLIKRRLALLERGTFASPDYLSRFGMPRTPDDLAGHEMVGFLSPDSGDIVPLVTCRDQRRRTDALVFGSN